MTEKKIGELVSMLTLEEKAGLTSGKDNWFTKAVERLGGTAGAHQRWTSRAADPGGRGKFSGRKCKYSCGVLSGGLRYSSEL